MKILLEGSEYTSEVELNLSLHTYINPKPIFFLLTTVSQVTVTLASKVQEDLCLILKCQPSKFEPSLSRNLGFCNGYRKKHQTL